MVNDFFELPNPYPEDSAVAVVRQSSQLVDETGRLVPLSEVGTPALDFTMPLVDRSPSPVLAGTATTVLVGIG